MGEAKRRKQLDPNYGKSKVFEIVGSVGNLTQNEYSGTAMLKGTWFEVQWYGQTDPDTVRSFNAIADLIKSKARQITKYFNYRQLYTWNAIVDGERLKISVIGVMQDFIMLDA
ncbi:hypothetical protein F7734_43225 [Scytonema sp. UIC 10036]|uniref:hypothetical protein n=1 Tax=Scytonema sp. UIC 10036 TaxID=2304196 RepID=UPI0012DA4F6A|nr:hypothetical protein [Scytonema sp. UIC 10036]MUG98746.1 hypothetical protein [Scytonema sp. UIC 10036]